MKEESKVINPSEQDFFNWINNNPDCIELADKAKFELEKPKPTPKWKKALDWLRGVIVAKPEDFHGTSLVTPELKKHSQLTANTVTVAGFLNFISNQSLFLFAFNGFGVILGPVASFGFNVCVLKFTNNCATMVSSSKKGMRSWSKLAFCGLIVLNAVQSIVAGVGIELMLNQVTIREERARLLVDKQIENEETRLQQMEGPTGSLYQTAKEKCEEFGDTPKDDPKYDQRYVQALGSYSDRNRDWDQVPTEDLPDCRQQTRLESEADQEKTEAQEALEAVKDQRGQITNIEVLEENYPAIYEQHYTEDGELASGTAAVSMATRYFLNNLYGMNFEKISFSLFFMMLSIITSFLACFLTFAHARRQDTQMSRSDEVQRFRDQWLENLHQEMEQRHQRELEEARRRLRDGDDSES
ncbi:MAG: hypothetical protein ACLFM2_06655 [Halothece sp.]